MPVGPVIALSHGGGPLPYLGDPDHVDISYSLRERVPKILKLGTPGQPSAIILVTAHWRTDEPRISSGASHDLLYDYYGFPPESYELEYRAKGDPELAREVARAFREQGFEPELDAERGWDHGVFIPMLMINPAANVPVVQVSVLQDDDPERHLRMGVALATLRERNVAIIGSGFASLHNFDVYARLGRRPSAEAQQWIGRIDEWNAALSQAVGAESRDERAVRMKAWRDLPHAYDMHPDRKAEHFMPLVVCVGAAPDGGKAEVYEDKFKGASILTYHWA